MASAVRLIPTPFLPIDIVGNGPFGARCGELLAASLPGCRLHSSTGLTGAFAARPGAVVLALWRPEPGLCESADELSFRHCVYWLPVIMEHPVIRVGPMIRPPTGPCYGCYTRRRRQHDGQPWATAALHAAYGSDDTCGPQGYLPHHARLAAAVAHTMLRPEAVPPADAISATVTTIRLVTGGFSASRVVACHGCSRCGTSAPTAQSSRIRDLSLRAGAAGGRGTGRENRMVGVR